MEVPPIAMPSCPWWTAATAMEIPLIAMLHTRHAHGEPLRPRPPIAMLLIFSLSLFYSSFFSLSLFLFFSFSLYLFFFLFLSLSLFVFLSQFFFSLSLFLLLSL